MVLQMAHRNDAFVGLVIDLHTPTARGIYNLPKEHGAMLITIKKFFGNRGVATVEGYRPGIGAAATGGDSWLALALKGVPVLGKALISGLKLSQAAKHHWNEYKKRKFRPFSPSAGLHLELWPAPGLRERSAVAPLMETLQMLPDLTQFLGSEHPGVKFSFLITSDGARSHFPHIQVDSDACSEGSMVRLVKKVSKGLGQADPPSHLILSRHWGVREKIQEFHDAQDAFRLVFLFPNFQIRS